MPRCHTFRFFRAASMPCSVGHEPVANHCSWSVRRHNRARSQMDEAPAVDGILPAFLQDFKGTCVPFSGSWPDSDEGRGGHFARRQREVVSLWRRHIRSDFFASHSRRPWYGGPYRATPLDQIAQIFQKPFTLHCPRNSSSRHSCLSRWRGHLPTTQAHTTPLPEQR